MTKDMQTEQHLCWSGMTDTEHSTTSGLNEEADSYYTAMLLTDRLSFLIIARQAKITKTF